MNFDFSALLVFLTFLSGIIWAIDAWLIAPRRAGDDQQATGEGKAGSRNIVVEYARSFFPVFLVVLLLRSFIVEPFRIPSASMMPTLLIGDFILVNKYDYGLRLPVIHTMIIENAVPERGDIVVFRYPEDPSIPYIKRVIGTPGDHIQYVDKILYINGEVVPQKILGIYSGKGAGVTESGDSWREEYLDDVNHEILVNQQRSFFNFETVVPDGHYFVMGDNRDNSRDSRAWGFVPDENLVGRAFFIWMNWDSKNGGVGWSRIGTILE